MSTYASRALYLKGCDGTVARQEKMEKQLKRQQNVSKTKYTDWIRSFDSEARQRDSMARHWNHHRQALCTQQDKFTQFNMMWCARDDMYRKRRDGGYQRRIALYNDQNEDKMSRTDSFLEKKRRVLTELPEQQKELLARKLLMTQHSMTNEVELYRTHCENPTMFVRPMTVPI